jgi:O-antigen ligase
LTYDSTVLMPQGPTRAERLALRVLQLGAVAVVLAAATYKVFELDRFFVPKELVLHLAALLAGLLALGAVRRVRFTRVDLFLLGYLLLGGLSVAFATNPWLGARALGVSVSGVAVFWAARALREAGLARPLVAGLALAVVVGAATALLQAYGARTDFFSLNRAPGGTLGNRNFVAHLAAFGLPLLLLSALRAWRGAGYLLGASGTLLVTGGLVLTRSRAAWLALSAALLVVLAGMLVCRPVRRDGRTWGRLAGILLLAGAGAAAALLLPNTLRWKSENPYLESVRGVVNYQEGSGRGRLIQYRNSARMAAGSPLLGVGPGNWAVEYPEYASRRDPSLDADEGGMTSNPWPSSDWVALLSERGLPALLLLALAFGGIVMSTLRRIRAARDADDGVAAVALLAILAATLVAGAFDAVLLLALPTLLVWAALGALWPAEEASAVSAGSGARVLMLLGVTLGAGAGVVKSAAQLTAMGIYATNGSPAALERASRLDPGSYRIHLRLARSGGKRDARCEHARAARDLYPNAEAARRLARRC